MLGPTLVGRSVTLGPLAPEHLENYCRWFGDPEVTRYLHRDNPPSLREEQEWFDHAVASHSEVVWGLFAEEHHIGSIGLSEINWRHRRATTGTLIGDKSWWGRGVATEAMELRTRYAFEELGLEKLITTVDEANQGYAETSQEHSVSSGNWPGHRKGPSFGIGLARLEVTVGDVQAWMDTLEHLAPYSRARKISSVKSLFGFGHRLGYLPFDVGRVVKRPKLKDTLAERILSEGDVFKLFAAAEQSPARRRTPLQEIRARRNYVLLRLLYTAGLRVDKIARLAWRDLRERGDAGQVTAYGKGGKTRVVLLPTTVWRELLSIRDGALSDAPIFISRTRGGFLTTTQVRRLVYAVATAAGLDERPSPHWLRHAHATHALERGAAIHLVQATLGHASVATTGRYLDARPTDSSARYLPV